jgi:Tol biopolymer transport system component
MYSPSGDADRSAIWLRPLDGGVAVPVRGTEGATGRFWHPDGHRIGFFAQGKLSVTDLSGSPPRTVTTEEGPGGRGGAWSRDGVIVFSHGNGPLFRVDESGGPPTPTTALDASRQEQSHRWPTFLPDGRRFLFTARGVSGEHSILLGSLDSPEVTRLVNAYSSPAYAEPGILLYEREGALVAHRFDPDTGALTGSAITVADRVPTSGTGLTHFSVSNRGVLAYSGGSDWGMQFVDRAGRTVRTSVPLGEQRGGFFDISPDGRFAAFQRPDESASAAMDVWILDLVRGASTRWTFDPGWDAQPVWSPDGRRIAYRAENAIRIRDVDSDEASSDELLEMPQVAPTDWSPDPPRREFP